MNSISDLNRAGNVSSAPIPWATSLASPPGSVLRTAIASQPFISQWNETEPPKDGQPLVIVGGVMCRDEFSTFKIPFCELAHWSAEHKDWIRWQDGLAVRRGLNEEVIVHFWMPYPQAQPGDRPPYTHQRWIDNED